MDSEDAVRLSKYLAKLLDVLQVKRVLTNHEVRAIAGSRGMARVTELKALGHPITTRKLAGSTWQVVYGDAPLARSAETAVAYPDEDCGPLFRSPDELGAFQR